VDIRVITSNTCQVPKAQLSCLFYNWSSYYAMAVIELGQAVVQAVRASKP